MPDIKTALQKVITEWEKPADPPAPAAAPAKPSGPHRFQPTNNVSRAAFDCAKNNQGLRRPELVAKLTAQGYKATSTSTLLTQMIRQGILRVDDNKRVFTNQPEYSPIKPRLVREARIARGKSRRKPAKEAPMPTATRRAPKVVVPLDEQKAQIREMAPRAVRQTPTGDLLEQLSIVQARELYDELRKIFGFKD